MVRVALFLSVVLGLAASGCTTTGTPTAGPVASRLSLEQWLDREALPYLVRELGEAPRFKDQSFLLVSMDRDNVEAGIDDLTMQIRETLTDGLLAKPGIGLVWRPSTQPWDHHTRIKRVDCRREETPVLYLGIDAGISPLDGKLHVKIRALDIAEKRWVTGFGISWKGGATPMQKKALARKQPDSYLLGLRPFPFNKDQADLLAAYLSRNMSCLFTDADLDQAVVYLDKTAPGQPPYFDTVFSLMANYIAGYREVTVTDDPSQANISVSARAHQIRPGLYQVWVTPRYKRNKRYVPGKETQAYALLGNSKAQPGAVPRKKKPQKTMDICFHNFRSGVDHRFYAILRQYPGTIRLLRTDRRCRDNGPCLCYELIVSRRGGRNIEKTARWLKKRLADQGITRFDMDIRSPSHLNVTFFAGFD